MILKIRFKEQWWLYDNIVKIRYNTNQVTEKFLRKADWNTCLVEQEINDSDTRIEVWEVCYRDKQDNERVMVFDGNAYILNDEGKTIERLPHILKGSRSPHTETLPKNIDEIKPVHN